jgi:uncharacterized protein (DUF2235 family)
MKRIITCSDGTWNRPGITDKGIPVRSNVELIFNCIPHEDNSNNEKTKQLKFYESGVGSSTFDLKDKLFGGIEGFGIDNKIKDIYTFILMNYEKGDELYLFGFSRGAYTIRSIAGFIRNCGILKPKNIHLLDEAYKFYRDRNDYTTPDSDFMVAFREKYCVENITPIKFIGVWDTVGSLGLPIRFSRFHNTEKYKFHDVKLSSHIENAYHALAIDEKRSSFEPTLWEISQNGIEKNQNVEQRWFTGVHCNVGGGYQDTGLSDLALKWLIEKAENTGLQMNSPSLINNQYYTYNPNQKGELRDSLNLLYRILLPKKREIGIKSREKTVSGKPINTITNEAIDDSVLQRYWDDTTNYKPRNLKTVIKKYNLKKVIPIKSTVEI